MAKASAHLAEIDRLALALSTSIQESISELAGEIVALNQRYRAITGEDFARIEMSGGTSAGAAAAAGTGKRRGRPPGVKNGEGSTQPELASKPTTSKKRIRRTTEQLKAQAENILAFIRKGGSDGVKGSAIRSEFGQILPSIKEFVKQYAGKAPKTKGEKAGMTYHVD